MQHTPRVLVVLACMSAAPAALACRYTVRDVGFVDFGGDPFRLCWVASGREGAPQAAFREIAAGVLYGSNVEYQVVTETTHPAMAAVGVNAGPALVLISPTGGSSYVLARPGEIPDDRDENYQHQLEEFARRTVCLEVIEGLAADPSVQFEAGPPAEDGDWAGYADAVYQELADAGFSDGDLLALVRAIHAASNLISDQIADEQDRFFPDRPAETP